MFRKPPYYLTAYGLAVREGFTGTLEQWLESLRGEKGDGVELRYQDDKLQWRSVPPEGAQIPEDWEEDEWKDLLELEDIRGPVVEQTLEQAQQAAQEATEAAGEAELMASHAQGHEQMAAQYAQEALEAARFVAVTTEYAVSEDGSTPPKAWETDIPELTAEKPFLWMKVNKNYTDGTAAADVGVIGRYSADGKDGSSTTITLKYGVSSTSSMNTITGWQDTIPQMSETYPYLWIEITTETKTATGGSNTVEAGIIGYYSTPGSGGNGAYTLPVANTETLGGVKPVAKTEAMTQPVGVDANGKLFTKPGKGGVSEWRLLNTVVCDGTASEYVFTKDDNGKDYHLEEISIYIYGYPAYNWGTAGNLRIDINKDGDNRSITTITNNVRCFIPIYANRFSGGYIAGDRLSNSKFPMESIDYVALNMGLGSQIFPSGWKIYVYGKDISGV